MKLLISLGVTKDGAWHEVSVETADPKIEEDSHRLLKKEGCEHVTSLVVDFDKKEVWHGKL